MRPIVAALFLVALGCSTKGPPQDQGGTGGSQRAPPVREICGNGIDDDDNGSVDCADLACHEDPGCPACGDGFLDPREPCDGPDLGGQTCLSLGYDRGILQCAADCTFDESSCLHLEHCDVPGDEDGNGKADCADPACARTPDCLHIDQHGHSPSLHPGITGMLQFVVTDGSDRPLAGQLVSLSAPPGAWASGPAASGPDGVVTFTVRPGRMARLEAYEAHLAQASAEAVIDVQDPAPGTVLTVVNATRSSGQDSSGPSISAALGSILDVQAGSDGTLYLAEPCRILAVSPEGELSVRAGGGGCAYGSDGPAIGAPLSVGALALDPAGILYFTDPQGGRVRSLDLAAGTLRTVAGGDSKAPIDPLGIAFGPGGLQVTDGIGQRLLHIDTATGDTTTEIAAAGDPSTACQAPVALQSCSAASCRPLVDPGGSIFMSGRICGSGLGQDGVATLVPGLLRIGEGGRAVRIAGTAMKGPTGLAAGQTLSAPPSGAFDVAGNLFLADDNVLFRVDGAATTTSQLNVDFQPGFGGDDGPVLGASFNGPNGLSFGPGGDLYLADTGNGAVRRIVGVGQSQPRKVTATVVSGDAQLALLASRPTSALTFRVVDDKGLPLLSSVGLSCDDPGTTIYDAGATSTGAGGVAAISVRLGLRPGQVVFQGGARNLRGELSGVLAKFTLFAAEPSPGQEIPLLGADGETSFSLAPGERRSGPGTPVDALGVALASDGGLYITTLCQVLHMDAQGVVEAVAGSCTPQSARITGRLALDEAHAVLYVGRGGQVQAIDLRDGSLHPFAGGGQKQPETGVAATDAAINAGFIALDDKGRLYMQDPSFQPRLLRVDPATGLLERLLDGAVCPSGRALYWLDAVAPHGDSLYLFGSGCSDDPPGPLLLDATADGALTLLANYESDGPMTLGSAGDVVFLDAASRNLERYDPATGRVTSIAATFNQTPNQLVENRDGHIIAAVGGPGDFGSLVMVW